MAFLRIPEQAKSGFTKLLRISDEAFDETIAALHGIRPRLFAADLAADLITKIKGVPRDDIVEIINSLWGLLITSIHHDLAPTQTADDIVQGLVDSDDQEIRRLISKNSRDWVTQRFLRLLNVEPLLVGAKAIGVLQGNQKTFSGARILTDVRPVFGSDVSTAPTAAVILHMLSLTYLENGEMKEFYIALDTDDIQTLRAALDRADAKCESLKLVIDRSGMTYLDPKD